MKKILPTLVLSMMVVSNANAQQSTEIEEIVVEEETISVNEVVIEEQPNDANKFITLERNYLNFKENLENNYGFSYALDVSSLWQRTAPSGKDTAMQMMYTLSANLDLFESVDYGKGSIQFSGNVVRYSDHDAEEIGINSGFGQYINNFPTDSEEFSQLTYTHQFGGDMDWLEVSLGQFPMYIFDGNKYNSNQQFNFINYSLAQNGTLSYPLASLGGYTQMTPNDNWSFALGFQDASNLYGETIHTNSDTFSSVTSFGSATYTPQFENLGDSEFSLLVYNQPSTHLQKENSTGYSVNLMQDINDRYGLFSRLSWVSDSSIGFDAAYSVGGVINDPLYRNELDQIGLAYVHNDLNDNINSDRIYYEDSHESVMEAYWAVGISDSIIITPDVQVYFNPVDNQKSDTGFATSLRLTLML